MGLIEGLQESIAEIHARFGAIEGRLSSLEAIAVKTELSVGAVDEAASRAQSAADTAVAAAVEAAVQVEVGGDVTDDEVAVDVVSAAADIAADVAVEVAEAVATDDDNAEADLADAGLRDPSTMIDDEDVIEPSNSKSIMQRKWF